MAGTNKLTVVFVPTKGGAVAAKDPAGAQSCGTAGPPGGWWIAECKGQGNGTGDTEKAVEKGCDAFAGSTPYHAVAGQQAGWTASQLSQHLLNACPKFANNETCLSSDPGNNFFHAADEWQTLVGKNVQMPVFCFPPECSPAAYSSNTNGNGNGNGGGGSTVAYAIKQIATVEVCGFNMGGNKSTGWPTSGLCKDGNVHNYTPNDVTSGDGLFVVIKSVVGGPVGSDWTGVTNSANLRLTQ